MEGMRIAEVQRGHGCIQRLTNTVFGVPKYLITNL